MPPIPTQLSMYIPENYPRTPDLPEEPGENRDVAMQAYEVVLENIGRLFNLDRCVPFAYGFLQYSPFAINDRYKLRSEHPVVFLEARPDRDALSNEVIEEIRHFSGNSQDNTILRSNDMRVMVARPLREYKTPGACTILVTGANYFSGIEQPTNLGFTPHIGSLLFERSDLEDDRLLYPCGFGDRGIENHKFGKYNYNILRTFTQLFSSYEHQIGKMGLKFDYNLTACYWEVEQNLISFRRNVNRLNRFFDKATAVATYLEQQR